MSHLFIPSLKTATKVALPAALAQSVQVILMIFLSRCAGDLGSNARLAANGLAEIIIVVTSIQTIISFGIGMTSLVSNKIGEHESSQAEKKQDEKFILTSSSSASTLPPIQKNSLGSWKSTNFVAVKMFWQSSYIILLVAIFVCTPLAIWGGPYALHRMHVDPIVVQFVSNQLSILAWYPIFFALYLCFAQLCVIEKRTDVLLFSSLPVVVIAIPAIYLWLNKIQEEVFEDNSAYNETEESQLFSTLAWGWLLAMILEETVIQAFVVHLQLLPPFIDPIKRMALPPSKAITTPPHGLPSFPVALFKFLTFSTPSENNPATSVNMNSFSTNSANNNNTPYKILSEWLLPSWFTFLAGYGAFEVAFMLGSGGNNKNAESANAQSTSSACAAATLVVAHQLRFLTCMIPNAFLTALNALLSRELGANNFVNATAVIKACFFGGFVSSIFGGIFLIVSQNWILDFFHVSVADKCVRKDFNEIVWQMAIGFLLENIVWQAITVLRNLEERFAAILLTIVNWWTLMLPFVFVCTTMATSASHSSSASLMTTTAKKGGENPNTASCVFNGLLFSQIMMTIPSVWYVRQKWKLKMLLIATNDIVMVSASEFV